MNVDETIAKPMLEVPPVIRMRYQGLSAWWVRCLVRLWLNGGVERVPFEGLYCF